MARQTARTRSRRATQASAPVPERPASADVVLLATGVLLLGALTYTVESILSPFVVFAGLLYLLYPWRTLPVPRRLIGLAVLLFAVWFVGSLIGILTPFILAFLMAYLLNPVVTWLGRRRIPRWAGSLISVLLLVGVVVTAAVFVIPPALQQFEGILTTLRVIVVDFSRFLESGAIADFLGRYGFEPERTKEYLQSQLTPRLESLLKALFEALFNLVAGISSVILQIINILIIPFVGFYLLKDYPTISERTRSLVPDAQRERFSAFFTLTEGVLGSYLRGALIVAILQGTIAAVGLWFLGVDYALVLGIMTGVLNFIPYIGLLTSLVVASIVAVFSGGPVLFKVFAVVALYLMQKLLEATVFGPKIVGSHVGLHPVVLILCLLVFGYFLGFVGMLIAVPATALLMALMREWELRRSIAT